jgi:succinoglycan biosynthesis protein ExoA
MSTSDTGVSFVIPVRNGEQWLTPVLDAVLAQDDGSRACEILVIDDGSADGSARILAEYAAAGRIRVLPGPRIGAAAALNVGVRAARHPVICQVDQDVIISKGWMAALLRRLGDPRVAAAQGYYATPDDSSVWARVTGLDLETRYQKLLHRPVNHVCTGNTAYRAASLRAVGLFDESLGYGYDNDMSYRLRAAGYDLVICPDARSTHRWRDSWRTYLVQQYGFGYGRIDLVAKHPRWTTGDDVSQWSMMLHAPVMAVAALLGLVALLLWVFGISATVPAAASAALVSALAIERLVVGIRTTVHRRDAWALLFPLVHLLRDLAWASAIVCWTSRRVRGLTSRPAHSMYPREAGDAASERVG